MEREIKMKSPRHSCAKNSLFSSKRKPIEVALSFSDLSHHRKVVFSRCQSGTVPLAPQNAQEYADDN